MLLSQPRRDLDPLVALARRHANVGEYGIGSFAVDRLEQRAQIGAGCDELQLLVASEELLDSLADDVAVLREHDPGRHVPSIGKTAAEACSHLTRTGTLARLGCHARAP